MRRYKCEQLELTVDIVLLVVLMEDLEGYFAGFLCWLLVRYFANQFRLVFAVVGELGCFEDFAGEPVTDELDEFELVGKHLLGEEFWF